MLEAVPDRASNIKCLKWRCVLLHASVPNFSTFKSSPTCSKLSNVESSNHSPRVVLADGSGPVPPPAVESALHASLEASGSGRAVRHFSVTSTPLPIPLPFPKVFRPEVERHGDVSTDRASKTGFVKGGVDVESVPVMSRLAVTPRLAPMLRSKLEGLERFGGFRKGTDGARILETWGFGEEETTEMRDGLRDMVKAYEGVSEEDSFDSD